VAGIGNVIGNNERVSKSDFGRKALRWRVQLVICCLLGSGYSPDQRFRLPFRKTISTTCCVKRGVLEIPVIKFLINEPRNLRTMEYTRSIYR